MTALVLKDILLARSTLEESNAIAEIEHGPLGPRLRARPAGNGLPGRTRNDEALGLFEKSLLLYREIGDQLNSTNVTIHKGQAYAALQCSEDARRLYREAYDNAQRAKWTPQVLRALISFVELESDLPNEIKLAVVLSVLSHSALRPICGRAAKKSGTR